MQVVNKRFHTPTDRDIYIGRGSVLGNPYSHLESKYDTFKVDTREMAVKAYKEYLKLFMDLPIDSEISRTIKQLAEEDKDEEIILVCFCKHPKREVACHGDVIKEVCDKLNGKAG